MIIAIVGATGVVGRNLMPRLLEAGHSVRAGVRKLGTAVRLPNVEEVECDILDDASLAELIEGTDVAINVASSIPRADGKSGDWKKYNQIRREGTENLIAVCSDLGVGIVAQSIAMLHCVDQSRVQDERSPMQATGVRQAALDLEHILADWGGNYRIVRGGNLYGPGTSTDDDWFDRYRSGELKLPGDGTDWLSCIHIADLAAAFLAVLEKAEPRTAWIAADDQPVQWNDLFQIVEGLMGEQHLKAKHGAGAIIPGFRVTNAALRSLGWAPRFSSIRSGLVATADAHRS